MKKPSEYNGIVVVDKPGGMTSHDVVDVLRRLFHTKRVGHTGTLDPDATGVLVLCLGTATRVAEYLSASQKNYITEIVFGVETDTQDASGKILAERDASHLTEASLLELLPRFRGRIEQIPPMVSALHHEGKRLYELAREGVTVERAARPVEITRLECLSFASAVHPVATLEVTCSTGTYIRTLAADIGASAGTGGMMQSLRRTWVGDRENAFTLEDAQTLESLRKEADAGTLATVVLPIATALRSWPQFCPDAETLVRLRHGQPLPLEALPDTVRLALETNFVKPLLAVLNANSEVSLIARATEDHLQPVKVLQ